MMPMAINDNGVRFIEAAEGFVPTLTRDGERWCIGYGCDLTDSEAEAYKGVTITQTDAEVLLKGRLVSVQKAINNLVVAKRPLNQNQFDALCSFVYNVGIGAFVGSTLLRDLILGNDSDAASQFLLWDNIKGVFNKGLAARRSNEKALFLSGTIG